MRLVVARCEVSYTGRLNAFLPEAVLPRLTEGALIAIDNTLWSGKVLDPPDDDSRAIAALNDAIAADERLVAVQLTVRDGVTLVRRR